MQSRPQGGSFPPNEGRPLGRAIHVPARVVANWLDRKTQIYPAETYAVWAALWTHRDVLAASDVIIFVDNEAAASSIIRGAPKKDDVGEIVRHAPPGAPSVDPFLVGVGGLRQ